MDEQIADIIFCLNKKGYKTKFSCAGHGGISVPYINFETDIDKIEPPLNFGWNRGKDSRILRMVPYNKTMGITRKKMQQTVSGETLEQYRLKNLEILRGWAKKLPVKPKQ